MYIGKQNPKFRKLIWSDDLKNNDLYSREIKPGVKVGKANGLKLLLDAETFDYTFHKSPSEGFKMAVQHHLDQPLMHVKELDISPGFETQIAVSPVLFSTTNEALRRFEPEQRGCYSGSGGSEVSSNVIQNLKVFFKPWMFT